MSSSVLRASVSLLLVLLTGCGKSTVKQFAVKASQGAVITLSAQDSQELAGTQISIPPGALAADTTITVTYQAGAIVPTTGEGAGPVVNLGPAGTTFSSPVTLRLPYTLSGSEQPQDLYMYVLEDDGTSQLIYPPNLHVDSATGTSTFQVSGFTRFQHGAHPCSSGETHCGGTCVNLSNDVNNCGSCNAACGANQACVSGSCGTMDGGSTQDGGSGQDGGSNGGDGGTGGDAGTTVDGGWQLVFTTPPQTLDAGTCSMPTTVQFEDGAGNPVVSGQMRYVNLSASASTAIYSGAGCTQPTQFVLMVPAGDAGATYSFMGQTSGPLTWTASSSGFDSGTQTETIR